MKSLLLSTLLLALCITSHSQQVPSKPTPRKTVAVLIFDGVQIIDYTGPFEVFGFAGYRVFTVAQTSDPITTAMEMKVIPAHTVETSPQADIIVVPGGRVPHDFPSDHPLVEWIKKQSANSTYLLSVCNGAFLLGATGLLDGKKATTTAGMIDHLQMFISNVSPVYDQRYVHDGKVVSAGGLSAGIDAALYIVSQIDSEGRAQQVANNMEYNWDKKGEYSRTRLVDFQLSKLLDFNPPLRGKTIVYEGDYHRWSAEYEVRRSESLEQFYGQFESMANARGWSMETEEKTLASAASSWALSDHNGIRWELAAEFKVLEPPDTYRASFRLVRGN